MKTFPDKRLLKYNPLICATNQRKLKNVARARPIIAKLASHKQVKSFLAFRDKLLKDKKEPDINNGRRNRDVRPVEQWAPKAVSAQ